jgi:hypothetical protein
LGVGKIGQGVDLQVKTDQIDVLLLLRAVSVEVFSGHDDLVVLFP